MRPATAAKRGFTLVEAMIGMALLSVITLAMAGTFLLGSRTLTTEASILSSDTAFSHASLSLTRDLASATTLPTGSITLGSTLTLTYGSPAVTVVYSITANRDLVRTANGVAQVVARGVSSVVITATGCYLTATVQPSAGGAAAVALNVSNRPAGCL